MCGMGLFVAFVVACNGVATPTPVATVPPTDRADEVTVAVDAAVPTALVQANPTSTAPSVVRATATEGIAPAPVAVESVASPTLTSTAIAADRVTTSVVVASTPIAASPEPTATAIPPPRPTVTAVPPTATPLSVGTEVVPESTSVADSLGVTASPDLDTPTAQPEPTVADATAQPTVTADYFDAYVEPCAPYPGSDKDPCERRVPWEYPSLKSPNFIADIWEPWPPFTVREWVDWKFDLWYTAPHFIVRGVAVPGSTRCASHAPPSTLLKGSETDTLETWSPGTAIHCYTDIAVREYIFGSGPSRITYRSGQRSVDEISPDFGTAERDSSYFADITGPLSKSLEGYEWIYWLTTPLDASEGAWRATSLWDVQRRDDGVIVGVSRYRRGSDDESAYLDELEPALDAFVTDTKAAMKHYVELYGGRVGESSEAPMLISSPELSSIYEYIKSMGALDIPGFTFTPPPPSPLISTAPTGLRGELRTAPQPELHLAWTAPVGSQVATYKIMRVDSLGTEIVVAEIPAEFVEVTDRNLPIAGAEYTYTVIAVNEHGESPPSVPFVLRVP